jgi:hypothetical protein
VPALYTTRRDVTPNDLTFSGRPGFLMLRLDFSARHFSAFQKAEKWRAEK